MQEGIHPKYEIAKVSCACGNTFVTRSTRSIIKVEICSACHPIFTGKQKLIDTAGRVEKFLKRFEKTAGKTVRREPSPVKTTPAKQKPRVLTTAPVAKPKLKR